MAFDLYPVIMAGGSGTRFWPASRRSRPKQFLPITGDRTMIEKTLDRALALAPAERTWVVTSESHAGPVEELMGALPRSNLLFEPVARDTAAAIGWAATEIARRDRDGILLVLPADHEIGPPERFEAAVDQAVALVSATDHLVTFGIVPDRPATGYGYIRRGAPIEATGPRPAFEVAEFCEKPDLETAERLLAGGCHYWNSGMFVWRAGRILDEIGARLPDLAARLAGIVPGDRVSLAAAFEGAPKISIDYGVMESADRVSVLAVDFVWDDVGSWEAVARHRPAEGDGNHVAGSHAGLDSRDLIVVAPDGHLVGTIGVEGLAIVVTPDATLVCPRDRVEDVKALVDRLAGEGRAGWL